MKSRKRYSLILEDESRLEKMIQFSASPRKFIFCGVCVAAALMAAGALLVRFTPARYLLPGYMKDSEREATEMQHLRLDSLQQLYATNEAYISNIIAVMNPGEAEAAGASERVESKPAKALTDTLLPVSMEERKFMAQMREQEKYDISVLAPLAAESMMFAPVSKKSVITSSSRGKIKAEIILAKGEPVGAIADGRVIAVSQSVREGGGSAVIIQHPKGFLSRCNRLGTVLIEPGDLVTGGQIIALTPTGNSRKNELISIEMWHNGNSLVPYDYLGDKNDVAPRYPAGGSSQGDDSFK